jgi:hypothetical protein
MLVKSSKDNVLNRGGILVALLASGLLAIGAGLIALGLQPAASASAAPPQSPAFVHSHPVIEVSAVAPQRAKGVSKHAERLRAVHLAARHQPHSNARSTISLYEHGVRRASLRRQGCSAAQRGVGGIVILDFGQPAYNGHTYGTYLFSGRFAGNKAITRAMLAYARGYRLCLAHGSRLRITLARGTSNYHPQVPSAYKAGRKWARETMALQKLLRASNLHSHVGAAAAADVEPAWDRPFHRTRDFFRGFRDARTGHLLYNFGSLDGGVGSVWSARQIFFVTSGMKYARAIPEIYNHAMAQQWADLAHIAKKRYNRPLKFAGVMTTHTSRNRGMKPNDAHKILVRALASTVREATPDVPPTLTNIVASAE